MSISNKSNGNGRPMRMPDQNFDWEQYKNGTTLSKEERSEQERYYVQSLDERKDSGVVIATVKEIIYNDKTPREVLVSAAGYKSAGVIPYTEFRYNKELKPGDEVEVVVVSPEGPNGQPHFSHYLARVERSWDLVTEAIDKDQVIRGYIKSRTRGGMIVDVFGIEAFLPGSQIDVRPIRDYDSLVDKTMEFKIVKVNPEQKNIVVSHKVLIEAEIEQQKRDIIGKLVKGDVLPGVVKNLMPFGVFVDLGGVDGLIHITDLSWERVSHPSEVVQLDQKIEVVVLDFDQEKNRIALGLKQLTPNPWDSLDKSLAPGDILKGRVELITDYGAFVEVAPGIEGLIHVSEMSWAQHLRSAQDFLKVGEEVEAVILTLDREERKMSLGMKQLKPDPWADIETRFPVASRHTAKVRNFTNFGVFVEVEEGVDGLIHLSDLSWTRKVKHPSEVTEIGAPIEVEVLEIDKDNRRLSLGHKQTEENPWDALESLFTVGSIHEGKIIELLDKGGVIALQEGVEGFATQKHLVKEDGSKAKVNETLEFKILEFDKSKHRVIVSHSRVFEDKIREANRAENAQKKQANHEAAPATPAQAPVEKATLGDLGALAALRDQLEDKE